MTGRFSKSDVDVYSLTLHKEYAIWSRFYYPVPDEWARSSVAQHHFLIERARFNQDPKAVLFGLFESLIDPSTKTIKRVPYHAGVIDSYEILKPLTINLPDQARVDGRIRNTLSSYINQQEKDTCLIRLILNDLSNGIIVGVTGIDKDLTWRLSLLSSIIALSTNQRLQSFSFCTHSYFMADPKEYRFRFWESGIVPDDPKIHKINYSTLDYGRSQLAKLGGE